MLRLRYALACLRGFPTVLKSLFACFCISLILTGYQASYVRADTPFQSRGTVSIAILISSQKQTTPNEVRAIKYFSQRRAAAINKAGGINGKKLKVYFLDDFQDGSLTVENVRKALKDENLVAIIGLWNSTRGAKVVKSIGQSGIPFISEISLNTMFSDYENIFTLTRSINDELRIFTRFVKEKARRVAFVGLEGDLYTRSYHDALAEMKDDTTLVASHWIPKTPNLDTTKADEAIANIKESNADLICLSIGSSRGAAFLERLRMAGIKAPIFVGLGTIGRILDQADKLPYEGQLYDIAEGGIPNVNNDRLEQLIRHSDLDLGKLGFTPYSVGYGARYADLLAMVAKAAAQSDASEISVLRSYIGRELRKLSEGKKVFRGWSQDWSFAGDRASAENTLIVWRPSGYDGFILAPVQYLRAGQSLETVPVIYLNLDMVRIFRVDSADKSFHAEFYVSMKSESDIDIDRIEFTNAYRGQLGNKPLISIRKIHGGQVTSNFSSDTKLYKVSGKFMFDPNLENYPFDTHNFSISFQPVSTAAPFFIQPPKKDLRDKDFVIDGWTLKDQYVGSNQDIITTIENYAGEERIIPYYKFNYTWVMERNAVDYFLRVVIPLSFILIVSYFSIFISDDRFESVVAIQVTALLSCIALYLSIPKSGSENATLSDQIFVFSYMAVSMMIGLSILRVNKTVKKAPIVVRIIGLIQTYIFPLVAGVMVYYVLAMSSSGASSNKAWTEVMSEYFNTTVRPLIPI